ncbi:hypothetical protein KUTeg_016858 [Tegillarca granosa]|uniref:Transposase n=1 Tax=Tegillarca granosa TaxID=220873 RepID=A0ABQ9ESQ9_TEGGR|nr:hypothetical protein KUTeg_016858 [Tegillarca granosa]
MDIHEQISFERVHRLGKPRNGKPPFIVAKFSSHKQRELDLITLIDNPQDLSSEYVLNTIVDNIGTIFVNSAKSVFGKSKVTFKGNNSKFKSWFGKECLAKRKDFHEARKLFNRNKTIVNKNALKEMGTVYRRTLNHYFRKHKLSVGLELRNMKKTRQLNILDYIK